MMDNIKIYKSYEKKHYNPPICERCGKPVYSYEDFEYIRTKRRSEIFIHTKCLRGETK